MKERFVKVNGKVYYESEIMQMPVKQINKLIDECKNGIDEVERRRADYESNTYENMDQAHYNEVISKFKAASVFLQSDIVLLNKILKERDTPDEDTLKIQWLTEYCRILNLTISKRKMNKAIELANEKCKFTYKELFY